MFIFYNWQFKWNNKIVGVVKGPRGGYNLNFLLCIQQDEQIKFLSDLTLISCGDDSFFNFFKGNIQENQKKVWKCCLTANRQLYVLQVSHFLNHIAWTFYLFKIAKTL